MKASPVEENNQIVQNSYDRRVLRTLIFIMSAGLAMIAAGPFAIFLGLPDFWLHISLAICIGFALLFFVGVLRFVSELGL